MFFLFFCWISSPVGLCWCIFTTYRNNGLTFRYAAGISTHSPWFHPVIAFRGAPPCPPPPMRTRDSDIIICLVVFNYFPWTNKKRTYVKVVFWTIKKQKIWMIFFCARFPHRRLDSHIWHPHIGSTDCVMG